MNAKNTTVMLIMLAGWLVGLFGGAALAAPEVTQQPYFRSSCDFSGETFADPTNPANDHLHQEFCHEGMTDDMTPQGMLDDPTNSTRATQKSSFWTTGMLFTWKTVSGETRSGRVEPKSMGSYYRTGTRLDQYKTVPMPFGAALKAGEGEGLAGDVKWQCGWENGTSREQEGPPDRCDGGELGVTVSFGECWDGVDRETGPWSVVQAVERRDGSVGCPRSHPVQIPELENFIDYTLPTSRAGRITVATNDGYDAPGRFHMNYMNAEDTENGFPWTAADDDLDLTADCINQPRNRDKPEKCAARRDEATMGEGTG